jgi:hypothetical protein
MVLTAIAQAPSTPTTNSQPAVVHLHYDEFWLSGSLGAGATVSTNIINSGAVMPSRLEAVWQRRHRRMGLGFAKELEVTPEQLYSLAVSGKIGISKLYFVYEQYIFRNSPINLGFSAHLGFFGTNDTTSAAKGGGVFGNIGVPLEIGVRPFYIFVRPDIEYQSWGSFHKQIKATVNVGIKLKFLSQEEKARRAAVKVARERRREQRHHRR